MCLVPRVDSLHMVITENHSIHSPDKWVSQVNLPVMTRLACLWDVPDTTTAGQSAGRHAHHRSSSSDHPCFMLLDHHETHASYRSAGPGTSQISLCSEAILPRGKFSFSGSVSLPTDGKVPHCR